MSKRILWLSLSFLMVLSLVIAACAPAAAPATSATPTAPATTTTPTTPITPKTPATPVLEVPKYGGWVNWYRTSDITNFDEVIGWQAPAQTLQMTNGDLLRGDWTRGPAGTGELKVLNGNRYDHKTGYLAESWEMPETGHWIFHIRPGVRYAVNPAQHAEASRLVAGREFNANDAEFILRKYATTPTAYIYRAFPGLRTANITALDKGTLDIKVPPTEAVNAAAMFHDFATVDIPKEVIDKYGNMSNWKNSVGTGAFMLTDFVPSSLATLTRNPNYFMKDPSGTGKGNQLPYVDGVRILIIPDTSTLYAALRTGRIDLGVVSWQDSASMMKTSPQLIYRMDAEGVSTTVGMRTDKPPFNDIRVRRALTMAIDYETLITTLTGGTGVKMIYPGTRDPVYKETFLPFSEAPASVQELYTYNPEKARQLLKEAGYPTGFKTTVLLPSVTATIDNMSILKDMWAKVGVTLAIDSRETGVFNSLAAVRNYDQLITGVGLSGGSALMQGNRMQGEGQVNMSYINDPRVNEVYLKVQPLMFSNPSEAMGTVKEMLKYVYDQAWFFSFPSAGPSHTFWWPWLKNFYGDTSIGWFDSNFAQFAWIDQNLKKTMGY